MEILVVLFIGIPLGMVLIGAIIGTLGTAAGTAIDLAKKKQKK